MCVCNHNAFRFGHKMVVKTRKNCGTLWGHQVLPLRVFWNLFTQLVHDGRGPTSFHYHQTTTISRCSLKRNRYRHHIITNMCREIVTSELSNKAEANSHNWKLEESGGEGGANENLVGCKIRNIGLLRWNLGSAMAAQALNQRLKSFTFYGFGSFKLRWLFIFKPITAEKM